MKCYNCDSAMEYHGGGLWACPVCGEHEQDSVSIAEAAEEFLNGLRKQREEWLRGWREEGEEE